MSQELRTQIEERFVGNGTEHVMIREVATVTDAPNGACMVKAKTRQWARAIERDLRGAGCKVQIHHPDLEQRTLIVSGTPDE